MQKKRGKRTQTKGTRLNWTVDLSLHGTKQCLFGSIKKVNKLDQGANDNRKSSSDLNRVQLYNDHINDLLPHWHLQLMQWGNDNDYNSAANYYRLATCSTFISFEEALQKSLQYKSILNIYYNPHMLQYLMALDPHIQPQLQSETKYVKMHQQSFRSTLGTFPLSLYSIVISYQLCSNFPMLMQKCQICLTTCTTRSLSISHQYKTKWAVTENPLCW